MSVKKEELKKVPYIDNIPSDGRTVFLQPYFDDNDKKFKMFVPQRDKITWIWAEPVQCCYYAKAIMDRSKDFYLRAVDIIVRHYSFSTVLESLLRMIKDIMNCGTVVEKYFIFLGMFKESSDTLIHNLIETDLEYYFGNVRSLYDVLQLIIRDLWKMATKNDLGARFAPMVEKNPEELKNKYDLPKPLIDYYFNSKDFFLQCRKIRDNIYHSWNHSGLYGEIGIVFCTNDGFALQKDNVLSPNAISETFDIWPEEKIKKNNLVSILALIAYINKKLLENLDSFTLAIINSIRPCPPISEKYKIFLRGPHIHHLLKSDEYFSKQWI